MKTTNKTKNKKEKSFGGRFKKLVLLRNQCLATCYIAYVSGQKAGVVLRGQV